MSEDLDISSVISRAWKKQEESLDRPNNLSRVWENEMIEYLLVEACAKKY